MERKNCYRDITVKEIGEEHIGQTLRVAGWVENFQPHILPCLLRGHNFKGQLPIYLSQHRNFLCFQLYFFMRRPAYGSLDVPLTALQEGRSCYGKEELLQGHYGKGECDNLRAKQNVIPYLGVPQIQITIFQPHILPCLLRGHNLAADDLRY